LVFQELKNNQEYKKVKSHNFSFDKHENDSKSKNQLRRLNERYNLYWKNDKIINTYYTNTPIILANKRNPYTIALFYFYFYIYTNTTPSFKSKLDASVFAVYNNTNNVSVHEYNPKKKIKIL